MIAKIRIRLIAIKARIEPSGIPRASPGAPMSSARSTAAPRYSSRATLTTPAMSRSTPSSPSVGLLVLFIVMNA